MNPNNSNTLVEVRGLHIDGTSSSGVTHILKDINLELSRGEVLGLIGESGAGKSTLGLALAGYSRDGCRFSAGTVTFDGIELTRAQPRVRRNLRSSRIAYVAQSAAASFNPAYRLIRQYAEFPIVRGLRSRREAFQDAIEIYTKMRLPDPENIGFRFPHQLWGGQLQRAMTAMAMACRPDLIIFDEPTTALDVTTQIEVLGAIRDIVNEYGTAGVYITHDLAVVAQMADRIKVLKDGVEVEEADTRTMLAEPKETYTKSLWAVREFRALAKVGIPDNPVSLLSIQKVSASYGKSKVIEDVSFDIVSGSTVAVVGESGSGKSTLARCITGLLPPLEGKICLEGRELSPALRDRSRTDLRSVQMIYQMADLALNPRHTIAQIIGRPLTFYLGLRGRAREHRVHEIMSMIGLDPKVYSHRLPGELSGGQKQRVGIARAIAAEPKLMICDEVTSALDQIVAEGILKLLDKLQRELDLAIMLITHDLATVQAIADTVVVMKDGQIVDNKPKERIFQPPYHPYTELLLASVPQMDPEWLSRTLSGPTLSPSEPDSAS